MKDWVLSLGSLVFVLFGCSSAPMQDETASGQWAHCYSSFETHVVAISGKNVRDCGFFTIDASATEKSKVKSCLKQVVESESGFRIGHLSFGDDSMFCDVAIRDEGGQLWSFFYDSNIFGGGEGGQATIWVSECAGIELKPGTIGRDSFFQLTECRQRDDIRAKLLAM